MNNYLRFGVAFSLLFSRLLYSATVDQDYNSAIFPVQYLVNSTFDVTQNEVWFNQSNFKSKTKTVFSRIQNPIQTINDEGGTQSFIKNEFFSSRVIPNIFLHTIGGAYDALWMQQYYEINHFKYAKFMAYTTIYLARFGNEITEADQVEVSGSDHIADLYIFDFASLLLASNDDYMSFLIEDLGMRAWHFQPTWNLKQDLFENTGLNYVVRPDVLSFADDKLTPFAHFGMQNIFGLSYIYSVEKRISLGAGKFYTDPLKREGPIVLGAFHESEGDIHSSLFYNGSNNLKWRLNLYPSIFEMWVEAKLGLFVAMGKQDELGIGLSFLSPVGISF